MCNNYAILDCQHCPLSHNNNGLNCDCDDFMRGFTDKANEIILNWCKEHPIKTRQSEFLKMFPNAHTFNNGIVAVCPKHIDTTYNECKTKETCDTCRKEYWLEEVEE